MILLSALILLSKVFTKNHATVPFNFRDVFSEEASTLKQGTGVAVDGAEQQAVVGEALQHQSHNLPQVHARDHLLIAGSKGEAAVKSMS